jgi:hypothetical protein
MYVCVSVVQLTSSAPPHGVIRHSRDTLIHQPYYRVAAVYPLDLFKALLVKCPCYRCKVDLPAVGASWMWPIAPFIFCVTTAITAIGKWLTLRAPKAVLFAWLPHYHLLRHDLVPASCSLVSLPLIDLFRY